MTAKHYTRNQRRLHWPLAVLTVCCAFATTVSAAPVFYDHYPERGELDTVQTTRSVTTTTTNSALPDSAYQQRRLRANPVYPSGTLPSVNALTTAPTTQPFVASQRYAAPTVVEKQVTQTPSQTIVTQTSTAPALVPATMVPSVTTVEKEVRQTPNENRVTETTTVTAPAVIVPPTQTTVTTTTTTGDIPVTLATIPPMLSDESKAIIETLPPEKTKVAIRKPPVNLQHTRKTMLEEETDLKQHEGIGIKISVRQPKADVNHMLETAYDALIAGNQEDAIEQYRTILSIQPKNKLALFGLATTYHRAGQIDMARPLYGELLAIDPHNKEALNNFLVLLADEAPQEALTELAELQKTHPDFSPVSAQMAAIYEKTHNYPQAIDEMRRALALAPENLKYRYNMAILLDKQGNWDEASTLYQQLLTANERGDKIPANVSEIQERLTFIRSNKPSA